MKNFQFRAVIPLLGLSVVVACGDDVSVYCSATASAGACEPPQPVVQAEADPALPDEAEPAPTDEAEPTPPPNEPAYLLGLPAARVTRAASVTSRARRPPGPRS